MLSCGNFYKSLLMLTGLADAESLLALKDLVNRLGGEDLCTEEVSSTEMKKKL